MGTEPEEKLLGPLGNKGRSDRIVVAEVKCIEFFAYLEGIMYRICWSD